MSDPGSPAGSYVAAPNLDTLVAYFVAAKKALSATNHVYHANDIVEDARKFIEEGTVLRAKNSYVRSGIAEQVNILRSIHSGLERVGAEAQVDFQAVVRSIDVANDRLQATLASLRKTIVSSALSSTPSYDNDNDDEPAAADPDTRPAHPGEDKTLYDFIDDTTHKSLLESVKATIDSYNDNQAALHEVRTSLGDSLQETTSSLADIDHLGFQAHDEQDSDISMPDTFHSLNTHATEMASLLQSLISHYDLCITALKHTEGGGEAARAATTTGGGATSPSSPDPLTTTGADSPTEASLYAGSAKEAHRPPLGDDERAEMLAVLAQDASQVEDVMLEIRERAEEMRSSLALLSTSTSTARSRFAALQTLLAEGLAPLASSLLPSCVEAAQAFRITWSEQRVALVDKIEALGELSRFYDSFVASYASLLREVERRKMVEARMEKVAGRAMREIEALQAEDEDMRGVFLREVGEWLPRDIWPGLMDGGVRWSLKRESGGMVAAHDADDGGDGRAESGVLP